MKKDGMDSNLTPKESKSRLSAIMFLDMVKYSAYMSKDETNTLTRIHQLETILKKEISNAGGRLVKLMGDGSMSEFTSATEAVTCAQNILKEIEFHNKSNPETSFQVRIGIHIGDVYEKDNDLLGDAVNIAARVEPLSEPGGFSITEAVYRQVSNKIRLRGIFIPKPKLKNISHKVRVFIVPPAKTSLFLFSAQRWLSSYKITIASSAIFLIMGAYAVNLYIGSGPVRLGLLYVRPIKGANMKVDITKNFEENIGQKIGRFSELEWISKAGMLDLFREVGIENPKLIEQLEQNACTIARKGGLDYSLVVRVKPLENRKYRLFAQIICTKTRSIVGSFSIEGANIEIISEKLAKQIQKWSKEI